MTTGIKVILGLIQEVEPTGLWFDFFASLVQHKVSILKPDGAHIGWAAS
jgi:hypothetical protein